MARLPKLCIHKPSQQYYVRLDGIFHYLGPVGGPDEEAAAEAQRAELLRRWVSTGGVVQPEQAETTTVTVLIAAYRRHLTESATAKELASHEATFRPWHQSQGGTRLANYGASQVEELRQILARGGWRCKGGKLSSGWCRKEINKAIGRVRRALRWGVRQGLVPAGVWAEVQAVPNLRKGGRETSAEDHPEVSPASEEAVAALLASPVLQPTLRDLVRLQLLTGARPGEIVGLRWEWIDQTGEIVRRLLGVAPPLEGCWVYLPGLHEVGGKIGQRHKTARHGQRRLILLGPQAQAILAAHVGTPPGEPIYSPRGSRAEVAAARRSARRSPVQPSQIDRSKADPRRAPGSHWTADAYSSALAAAIRRENRRRAAEGLAEIAHFSPGQLRHNAATRLVDQFGWEVARIVLGHTSVSTTRIYAADNFLRAAVAVAKDG